jgi:DNA polymerase
MISDSPTPAMKLLMHHLVARRERGISSVALNEAARSVLRAMVKAQRAGVLPKRIQQEKANAEEVDPTGPSMTQAMLKMLEADQEPSEDAKQAREVVLAKFPVLSREEKSERLAHLRQKAAASPTARALGTLRSTMVFAVGDPMSPIVFVGEAPGKEEEIQQEPFVGPAGELLTKIIQAMGLARTEVYITNICKFRPQVVGGTFSENRKPTPEEMASCIAYVKEELEIIRPQAIVALGATAAEGLLGLSASAVGKLRQGWQSYRGVPVKVTYHPSYLLRNQAQSEKRKVWEDMLEVLEKLALPISEKQRGYFLKG